MTKRLRGCAVYRTTQWTASVCTGALILGAAGLLKGVPATTHWSRMNTLRIMGARPEPNQRVVRSGKIITAAGVSAGIDLALWLAGEVAGHERAEMVDIARARGLLASVGPAAAVAPINGRV